MKKKKIMFWCSLLLLILLKVFAIYKGINFGIIPKGYDIVTFVMIGLGTFVLYLLNKIVKKNRGL